MVTCFTCQAADAEAGQKQGKLVLLQEIKCRLNYVFLLKSTGVAFLIALCHSNFSVSPASVTDCPHTQDTETATAKWNFAILTHVLQPRVIYMLIVV